MPSSVARRAARHAARLAAEAWRPTGRGSEGWWSSQLASLPCLYRASSTNPKDTGPAASPPLAAPPPPPPPPPPPSPPPSAPPPLPTLPPRPPRPRPPLPLFDGCGGCGGCSGCGGCDGGGGVDGGGGGGRHGILDSGAGGFSSGTGTGTGTATGTATATGTGTVAATSVSGFAAACSSVASFAAVSWIRGLRRCSGHRNASGSSSPTLTPSSASAGMLVAAAGGWSTLLGGETGRCVEDAAGCCSNVLRAMSSSVAARSADADAGQRGGPERGPDIYDVSLLSVYKPRCVLELGGSGRFIVKKTVCVDVFIRMM